MTASKILAYRVDPGLEQIQRCAEGVHD
jgi:hypothetical protein